MQHNSVHPIILIVLDGWGYSENPEHNAIMAAKTPFWDQHWAQSPYTLIEASSVAVGLPQGQMGNSEVGHMHLGAGRVIYQDLTRINRSIEANEWPDNPTLEKLITDLKDSGKTLHLMGLLSEGGVHSHADHFHAALELAANAGLKKVMIHGFLDGRDTPPRSALPILETLNEKMHSLGVGKISTLIGRYYAMDRDQRFDRTAKAYQLLTQAMCQHQANDISSALNWAYQQVQSDEFVPPIKLDANFNGIENGDAVWFINFRADRARQITHAFVDKDFSHFSRERLPKLSHFVSMTPYSAELNCEVVFPREQLSDIFGECLEKAGLKQLRIAETEKYAHVTFFFNGGREQPFTGEQRCLIPSPKVATYDLQPEMSAKVLTSKMVEAINSQNFHAIIANFANPDMVGHTGDFAATVKAIECIDQCISQIAAAAKQHHMDVIITADHGNAEKMFNPATGQAHTAHTDHLVPCLYLGRQAKPTCERGSLIDIAPTLLKLMGLAIPKEMTGQPLFELIKSSS